MSTTQENRLTAADVARSQYLAAAEALSALFNGTAWIVYFLSFGVDAFLSSMLMLRTKVFSKTTAYMGIFMNIGLLSIFAVIPSFALPATIINLVTTTIGTIWNVLVALSLFRLGREAARMAGQRQNTFREARAGEVA